MAQWFKQILLHRSPLHLAPTTAPAQAQWFKTAVRNLALVLLLLGLGGEWVRAETETTLEENSGPESPTYLRPRQACPADLETLMTGLLRDLPSYANRVASRQLAGINDLAPFGTILLAGRAEFEPLDIRDRSFSNSVEVASTDPVAVQQVFFTTLERQYTATQQVEFQQYHWLFLTPTEEGWYRVVMFSRLGQSPSQGASRPPTPPQESSDGIIGQAVDLWLRDCRARAIDPIDAG
ncbi:hypothetical protein [Leptolyngbya sp. PCC 6406]|uniref:hypothetical protein n=1 Tax=Leptolyngbya sp. PCC 6406 TaxID=1173264 RepID=UPI0002AC63C3|nr:hypothetical protein [Leptolyngbya sp. PCC 6406]